jgi:hypothetical protein
MEGRRNKNRSRFVQYNDDNITHALAGPEYGQPWRTDMVWEEIESTDYMDFVNKIQAGILCNPFL